MPRVTVSALAPTLGADEMLARLHDFERYPSYTSTVIEVRTERADELRSRTAWEVVFRNGTLKWVEDEVLDPGLRRIEFVSVSGDLERFEGHWVVQPLGDGSAVTFDVEFESGLGTLSEMVDPVAERTLRDSFDTVLRALASDGVDVRT